MNKYLPSLVILLAACQEQEKNTQKDVNLPPSIGNVNINPEQNVRTNDTLNCNFNALDEDGDRLSVEIGWINELTGEILGSDSYIQLNADMVNPDDNVVCEVKVTDEEGSHAVATSKVTVLNSEPSVADVEITSQGTVHKDAKLDCLAKVSDPDEEEQIIEYEWLKDGETLTRGATIRLQEHNVEPNDTIACVAQTTDPQGASDSSVEQIEIENRVPQFNRIHVDADGPIGSRSLLTCSAEVVDLDGDETELDFKWFGEDGSILGQEAQIQLDPSKVSVGETIRCEVSATDGRDGRNGEITQSIDVEITNTAPSWLSEASISPKQDIEVNAELLCDATAADPDGEELTLTYEWKNATETLGSGNKLVLNENNSQANEDIQCVATAIDPHGASISSEASVIVENTAPVFTAGASILPNTDTLHSTLLSCEASAFDANGDTVKLGYQWSNTTQQTQLGSDSNLQLDISSASPGDEIQCVVTAQDNHGGTVSSTSTITVSNALPTFTAAPEISPNQEVSTNATLVCMAEAEDEEDSIDILYRWKNVTQNTKLGSEASLILDNTMVQPNDQVECLVTVKDKHGGVISSTVSVNISNSAPSFTNDATITTSGNVYVNSTLDCEAEANDIDGDSPNLTYEWQNESTNKTLGTNQQLVLDASIANTGEEVSCTVTAMDVHGKKQTSVASVEIQNAQPSFTSSTVIKPNGPLVIGVELTCDAAADDPDGIAPVLSYVWQNVDQSIELDTGSTLLLEEGMAQAGESIRCTVTATDSAGETIQSTTVVQLENTAPSFTQVAQITSASGFYNDSTLKCDAIATDIDGSTPSLLYMWENETTNTRIGLGPTMVLKPELANSGDSISCKVTAVDMSGSVVISSSSIVLQSTAPTFSSAAMISPASGVVKSTELTCNASATDRNGSPIALDYQWVNDTKSIDLATGETLSLMTHNVDPMDLISCIVTATSNGESETSRHSVQMNNSAPAGLVAGMSIDEPEANLDDIQCEVETEATDIDGQALAYHFDWSINGADYSGSTIDTSYSGDTLPAAAYEADDVIGCKIIATDGMDSMEDSIEVTGGAPEDSLSVQSDEFNDSSTMSDWNRLYQTEGWTADQLEVLDIDDNEADKLSIQPYANGWHEDYRGSLMFKSIEGNFVVSTQVQATNLDESGAPSSIGSLAGLMIRAPKAPINSPWTAGQENSIMLSIGSSDTANQFQMEAKNTENSVSGSKVSAAGNNAELRIARVGSSIILMSRVMTGEWQIVDRYSRADLPASLQVGLTATTDWDSVAAIDVSTYNNTVISDGNPDLVAEFDYIRFITPQISGSYTSADLSDDTLVSDADLLSMLGSVLD